MTQKRVASIHLVKLGHCLNKMANLMGPEEELAKEDRVCSHRFIES